MPTLERLAIKRLSASDLTFFKCHFENTSGTKQKAWNLDKETFIKALYPSGFGEIDRLPIGLLLHGPGSTPPNELTRKIKLEAKNWRLNGELIHPMESNDEEYSILEANDFAIIHFIGEPEPKQLEVFLISTNSESDQEIHRAISEFTSDKLHKRKSMLPVTKQKLLDLIPENAVTEEHPLACFLQEGDLEDYVLGGFDGFKKLKKRSGTRTVTQAQLDQAAESAKRNGKLGEILVNDFLTQQLNDNNISSFKWEADVNPIAPYDFSITEKTGTTTLVDAKSTSGSFGNRIHISVAELTEAAKESSTYKIYRVYDLNEISGKLRISANIRDIASEVLRSLEKLPTGVNVDSVSIDPATITFDNELEI